jgi:excisionase family DNA binding protein
MRPPPSASPIPPDAILLSEAAELLGLAVCSVWRRLRDGSVRAWRVGNGRWRVSRAEVLAMVSCNSPRPEVVARADRERELAEVDAVLRAEGVRR